MAGGDLENVVPLLREETGWRQCVLELEHRLVSLLNYNAQMSPLSRGCARVAWEVASKRLEWRWSLGEGVGERWLAMSRAAHAIFLLTIFSCANTFMAQIVDSLPYLDIACAFAMAWATAHLSRAGGTTTIRVALVLMGLRWFSSLASLGMASAVSSDAKRLVVLVELAGFCTLSVF